MMERRYNRKANAEAMKAHRERMISDGMLSEEIGWPCILSPNDGVSVQRIGPGDTSSTYIRIKVTMRTPQGDQVAFACLYPPEARAFAAEILNEADEADPAPAPASLSAAEWQAFGSAFGAQVEVWDDED